MFEVLCLKMDEENCLSGVVLLLVLVFELHMIPWAWLNG